MKDAIIVTQSTFELLDFKLYGKNLFEFVDARESEIKYYKPNVQESYISITKDNSMFDLMESYGREKIESEFETFNIFLCLFYNFSYIQSLVASIPLDKKIIFDNDHGILMNREEFLKLNSYEEFVKDVR